MNFTELDNNGLVEGFVLVKSCDKKTSKNGSMYLDITFADKTGEINAKYWDYREGVLLPQLNTVVKVRGVISAYNGVPQLKIERIRNAWDSDNINLAEFVPTADYDGGFMLSALRKKVEAFENEDLKKIVSKILDDYADRLVDCPAAVKLHHAIRGGLLMHTLSIVRLCESIIDLYPSVDGELLISGAILHDVSKTEEFSLSPAGLADGYTVEGTLVGHLVMGAMLIDRTAEEVGADKETAVLLEHMLLSHHGEPEFGAAVRPLFLEAEILSSVDSLDSKIYEIERAVSETDPHGFTPRQWALDDRKFYNHARKPIECTANLDDEDNANK